MRKTPLPIPLEQMKEHFIIYPGESGLVWIKDTSKFQKKVGSEPSMKNQDGYYKVGFKGKVYTVSRVIWSLYHNIPCPIDMEIDHIDRNNQNNNPWNLRLVNRKENINNRTLSGKYTVSEAVIQRNRNTNFRRFG